MFLYIPFTYWFGDLAGICNIYLGAIFDRWDVYETYCVESEFKFPLRCANRRNVTRGPWLLVAIMLCRIY